MELVPGDHISDYIAFTGIYDYRFTKRVVQLAREGGTMIDVGANIGYFSLLWCALNSKNRSIAFEASPLNAERLRRNIALNHSKVTFHAVAVGATAGRMSFDIGPAEQTGWGGFTHSQGLDTVEIDVVRVDEQIDPDVSIELLKVDIEGADAWALMGCERLLRERRVSEIWFEQNKPRAKALDIPADAAQTFLRSVDYVPEPRSDPDADTVQWVATPSRPPRRVHEAFPSPEVRPALHLAAGDRVRARDEPSSRCTECGWAFNRKRVIAAT